MSDEPSWQHSLLGNEEDVRTLVEWQQQRYHQLQNLSLALLGVFFTILAVIATILTSVSSSPLISFPSTEAIRQLASKSLFGYAAVSSIIGLNFLLSIFLIGLSALFGVFGVYKLYNIIANPPLEPRFERLELFCSDQTEIDRLKEAGFHTVQEKLRFSFHRNKNLIRTTRHDFRMALIRLPAALIGGYSATLLHHHTVSLNLINVLEYDLIFLLPASAMSLVLSRVFRQSGNDDSGHDSIAQEISKEDGGRFPNEFIGPEKWVAMLNNLLVFLIFITVILELGWKYAN